MSASRSPPAAAAMNRSTTAWCSAGSTAAHVVDGVEVGTSEPDEGLLHHVLGQADVAEHTEGDVEDALSLTPRDVGDARIERRASRHPLPPRGMCRAAARGLL